MPGDLAITESMPPPSFEPQRHTLVVPLDYEPPPRPESTPVTRLTMIASGARRLCMGAGVAFVIGGAIMMFNPRADEEAVCIAMGLGLITAAMPMPTWWRQR